MSDQKLWGTALDVDNKSTGFLNLESYGPRSQIDPPLVYRVCTVCGFVYRIDDMIRYKRNWYCRPQNCYRDITGIELKKSPEANFKNRSLGLRFWRGGGGSRQR
jgi:hypothetical protein